MSRKKVKRVAEPTKVQKKVKEAVSFVKDTAVSLKDKIKNVLPEKKTEETPNNSPLAEHADQIAEAMKKVRTKNEMFSLARLMKKEAKEIENIARRM